MKKRITAILFALIFAANVVSCSEPARNGSEGTQISDGNDASEDIVPTIPDDGSVGNDSEIKDSENEDAEKRGSPNTFEMIPTEDNGGREFVIVTSSPDFVEASADSGMLGSYIYERNRAIEEKFNIKFTIQTSEDYLIQSALQNAVASEIPYCDLLYAPMDMIASCGGSGVLTNIYSVPFFSYDGEHTDKELIESLSQSDTTFGVYGDAAFDERSMWCVYYNKAVLRYLGFPDPYEMVKNGTWTWDMFLAISEGAMMDLDGDGVMSAQNDRYGYSSTMNTSSLVNAVFASFGKNYFSKDDEGFLKMDYAVTDGDDYISDIRNICVMNGAKYPERDPGASAVSAFNEGRLAFFCEKLSYAPNFAYIPLEWGILPMPKRNVEQTEYFSWVDSEVCGYAVPRGVSDSSLSGKVLNAIYAYDHAYGGDELTTAWTYYYLNDGDSAAALKKIASSPVYDVAYAFGNGMPDFSMVSYGLLRSVMEQELDFSYLYNQSIQPFSDFVRDEFVN